MERVGILGVGAMGSALLERLKLAGVRATAYDSYSPSLETARSLGADIATSASAVARASTLIDVVVRTDEDVMECMLGKDGVLDGASPGALVLLHSTILPQTTEKVAEAARQKQIDVIDACMLGVPKAVRQGELTFLVGGPVKLIERARPHLLKMGKQVLHMGSLGAGNVAKLIKNLVSGSETLIIHEAIRLGEAGGIPYLQALEMLRQTYTGTLLERWQSSFDASGKSPTPRVGRNIFAKDIPLTADLARLYGLNLPIIEALKAAGLGLVAGKEG